VQGLAATGGAIQKNSPSVTAAIMCLT
jgi:hypothetical protein